ILVDHRARDGTPEILERIASESPIPAEMHRVGNPSASHELIKGYAGSDVWVFGVDGDELYDPAGLSQFREQILGGESSDDWLVRANMLHCVELDEERGLATGYLSPPAPSVSKLLNFKRIEGWGGAHPDRLHDP